MLFLLGLFWKKATANGALSAAISSAVLSLLAKLWLPHVPFMDRVGYVFIVCLTIAVVVSLVQGEGRDHPGAVKLNDIEFNAAKSYKLSAAVISLILICFYATWW